MVQDHRFVKSMFSQELDRIIISHQDAVHGEALDPSELALILIRGILTENMRHRREYSHTALPQFFKELPDALVSEEIRSHTALRIDPLDCAALSSDPLCNSSELLLCLCQSRQLHWFSVLSFILIISKSQLCVSPLSQTFKILFCNRIVIIIQSVLHLSKLVPYEFVDIFIPIECQARCGVCGV